MSNLCNNSIATCISADCENPIYSGMAPEALIANYDDIASITYDASNGSIINGITMATDGDESKCFYTVLQLGQNPFEGSQTEMVEGTYGNKFNQTVVIAIPDNGPEVTNNIVDKLATGRFTMILENDYRHTNGDNRYSVVGAKKGLKATSITREAYGDNEGAWIATLVEENTPKSGLFFYANTDASTAAAVEALKCNC